MPFNALIFDFNGLIVDDEAIHCELFQKVLAEEEITLTDNDYWNVYLGYDDKGLIKAVFERDKRKLTPKILKNLINKKSQLYFPALRKKLRFFPGVIEFIKKVKDTYHLAVVSGALRAEVDFGLKQAGVDSFFPIIIAADDTRHGKPDPEGFVLALAQLKKTNPEIRPETCLVLEDSHAGIEAAHRAGMKVVALPHTYTREELEDADYVVDSFGEILSVLAE